MSAVSSTFGALGNFVIILFTIVGLVYVHDYLDQETATPTEGSVQR